MATAQSGPASISEQAVQRLDGFAEKNLRAAGRSELLAPVPAFVERGAVYLISGALFLTILLLYFGKVSAVVNARGVIVPEGDVRLVQALESGVVKAVLAHAGDRLPAGAALVNLDISESGIDLTLQKRKQELDDNQLQVMRATVAQMGLILANPRLVLDPAAAATVAAEAAPAVNAVQSAVMKLEAAKGDFEVVPQKKQLQSRQIELIRQRTDLLEKNQKVSAGFIRDQDAALEEKRKQLGNYRRLAANKMISPLELSGEEEKFRAAESGQMGLRQQYDDREVEIANQKLNYAEGSSKLQNMEAETNGAFQAAQHNQRQSLASLRQQRDVLEARVREMDSNLHAARRKIEQGERHISFASIVMPVAGVVAELKTKNTGELVAAGSVVATIVPDGVPLVVNAEVPNKDIGFVTPGLAAQVKIDAYPYEQFGIVPAVVETVLPAIGGNNFPVKLRLLSDRLNVKGNEIRLFPGLTIQADLLTTKQRLLELLLAPGAEKKKGGVK